MSRRTDILSLILVSIVSIGLGVDLWTKRWSFETVAATPVYLDRDALLDNRGFNPIPPHPGKVLVPPRLLNLQLVLNSGAVFGIGSHQRGFFIIFTLVAVGVTIYIFGWHTRRRSHLAHLGVALILAGALGNLWDRVMIGRVRDFLHLFPGRDLPWGLSWPGGGPEVFPWIFNIADVLLLTGMGLVLIHLHWSDRRQQREARRSASASPSPTNDQARSSEENRA